MLIALECIERHDEHTFGALRAEPHIDVVKAARRGGNAHRRSHTAGQPVEIEVGPERLCAIRTRVRRGRVQINDVEVRLVRESATAETPKSQNKQFSLAEPTVHLLELARRRGSEGIQGAFGYPGIA